jgi:hypothetical protein
MNLFTWTWRLVDTGLFWSRASRNQGGACMADDRMTYQVGTVAGDDESFIKLAVAQWAMCQWGPLSTDGISLPISSTFAFPLSPSPHSRRRRIQQSCCTKSFPFFSFEKHSLRPPPLQSYPGTFSSRYRVQVGTPFPFGTAFSLGLFPRSICHITDPPAAILSQVPHT